MEGITSALKMGEAELRPIRNEVYMKKIIVLVMFSLVNYAFSDKDGNLGCVSELS